MAHFAHTRQGQPPESWELLEEHLQLVAARAAQFAAAFGAADLARLAGLWHDVGKYSTAFQDYLRSAGAGGIHQRVDHATAGAQHAASVPGTSGQLLAYCIAGHHGGLPDRVDEAGGTRGLSSRLNKEVAGYSAAPKKVLAQPPPEAPAFNWDRTHAAFQLSMLCRMLFSCLVDADYLATEEFMRPEVAAARPEEVATIPEMLARLDAHLAYFASARPSSVNQARSEVLAQCRAAAELAPGLFSLTVPTGGGKTLSSLAFALSHAERHDLRRVIYAIPFTSIIEQNAQVFRNALGDASQRFVLEHHSNFEPPPAPDEQADLEPQTAWHRLAAENWDAPLIVTTNVQLLESLFASRTSRCRKLHRIARSVIILDECQTLPVTLLEPTLAMLAELCRNYGCTVVLCSATQPAVQARTGFSIGLSGVREIVRDPPALYESLRRVEVRHLGKLDDAALVEQLRRHEQVLCVVNTRGHAARLFDLLRDLPSAAGGVFHLSAQMCAAHRTDVLAQIRTRLEAARPQSCRVISTQLIEAGVDVDFPVVYRALAGLDSVAQAAGRCNREGRHTRGDVYVFETDVTPTHDVKRSAQLAAEVTGEHADLLSLSAINQFFRLNYWSRKSEWDKEGVLDCFSLSGAGAHFQFREAAEKYRLIRDARYPVVVPYGNQGRRLAAQLRGMAEPPGRSFDRRLQRYAVGVHESQFRELCSNQAIGQYHERFWVLENDAAYDEHVGLRVDAAGFDPDRLYI